MMVPCEAEKNAMKTMTSRSGSFVEASHEDCCAAAGRGSHSQRAYEQKRLPSDAVD
jgi:hypothetical protein